MQATDKYMRVGNPKMADELVPRYKKLAEGWTIESFRDKAKDFGRASQDFNDFCYAMEALPGFNPPDVLIDAVLQSIKCTAPFVDAAPYEHRIMMAAEIMNGNLVDLFLDLRYKLRCIDQVNTSYNNKQDAVLYSDNKRYHLFDSRYWKIKEMSCLDYQQYIDVLGNMHDTLADKFTPFVVPSPGTYLERRTDVILAYHWSGFNVLEIMRNNKQETNFLFAEMLKGTIYKTITIKSPGGKEIVVTPDDHDISYSGGGHYLQIVKKKPIAQAA